MNVPQIATYYKFVRVHIDTTILHSNNRFTPNGLNHIFFINTFIV